MQLMHIHSMMPCSSGRKPTARRVSRVSDAPMKKSESVIMCLARLPIAEPMLLPAAAASLPIS